MIPDDDTIRITSRADLVAYLLARQRADFLRTSNPVYAWRAYQIARSAGAPLPEWVLVYFDECAVALASAKTSDEIAAALQLATKGGGPSQRHRTATHDRHEEMIEAVHYLRSQGRLPVKEIFTVVAEQFGGVTPER